MEDISLGSLVTYDSDLSDEIWEDTLSGKVGVITDIVEQEIKSNWIPNGITKYTFYKVFMNGKTIQLPKWSIRLRTL